MDFVSFAALPFPVRFATMSTFFIGWVLFAELIIDRHGLDRFLPFYKVGNLCPYDFAVVAILGVWWWFLHRG